MKIAYLITAYENPHHLQRLVSTIVTPQSEVFIHLDAKSDATRFKLVERDHVYFVEPRIPVYWGEFSMVRAILLLMQRALASPQRCDYLCLISAADYPLRPIHELHAFFEKHAGSEFMNITAMPNEALGKPISRLQRYKVPSDTLFRVKRMRLRRTLASWGWLPTDRDYLAALGGLQPFGGSTWFALTREACRYVLDFIAREARFVRFYRDSKFPDEGMIHTIIGNSPFAARIRRNLTYTDWRGGGRSPAPISQEHIERFLHDPNLVADDGFGPGEVFFARKFGDDSAHFVDQLDAQCVRPAAASASPRVALR